MLVVLFTVKWEKDHTAQSLQEFAEWQKCYEELGIGLRSNSWWGCGEVSMDFSDNPSQHGSWKKYVKDEQWAKQANKIWSETEEELWHHCKMVGSLFSYYSSSASSQ